VLPVKEKDAWLSTFVKAEKLNISAKPDPAPRVIQPRDPRYNVELGRYLRHSEEYLFKAIDKVFGGRTIFKGISADTAGQDLHECGTLSPILLVSVWTLVDLTSTFLKTHLSLSTGCGWGCSPSHNVLTSRNF